MKAIITTMCSSLIIASAVFAQDLPKPSPHAKVEQRIGLTDISVEYSRPGVKGRVIWGDLVPFDKEWRAGANKNTLLETSTEINIEGQTIPAGKYSVFIIPSATENWTFILNKNTEQWGTGDYTVDEDQARISIPATKSVTKTERLEFHFTDVDMTTGVLSMEWAGRKIDLKIKTDPSPMVEANIKTAIAEAEEDKKWRVYRGAASYSKDVGQLEVAVKYLEKSLSMKDYWYSYWIYADIMALKEDYAGAIEKAEKSISMGKVWAEENERDFSGYEEDLNADIAKWKGM